MMKSISSIGLLSNRMTSINASARLSHAFTPLLRASASQLSSNVGVRAFSQSPVYLYASTPNSQAGKLKQLKTQLKKEKDTYQKLKQKLSKEQTKINEKRKQAKAKEAKLKAKAKNDKLLEKALKSHRKLSPFNMFVKELKGNDITTASNEWKELSELQKQEYQDKADEYNQQQAKLYPAKPKAPTFGFAAFMKANYVNDGRDGPQILKDLSRDWNSLTADEKSSYAKDDSEWQQYQNDLKNWKQDRVNIYNQQNGTNITL